MYVSLCTKAPTINPLIGLNIISAFTENPISINRNAINISIVNIKTKGLDKNKDASIKI
tara:strand:- start:1025 stop:1201 length:177 start_codon:yes stop_codon:yes gene_type:complete